jgi:hypothetical protein
MSADKLQPRVNKPPVQAKPGQGEPPAPQSPATVNAQPTQRTAPGRKPLFRH